MISIKFLSCFLILLMILKSASTIKCHLCDSCEDDDNHQYRAYCEGNACITREGHFNGKIRIQKMCQISGNHPPIKTEVKKCYESFLWQGIKGQECVCNFDWCNSTVGSLLVSNISIFFSFLVFAVVRLQ